MNYDHNKKFGLLKFHSGYEFFYLNSPNGCGRKIINAQLGTHLDRLCMANNAVPTLEWLCVAAGLGDGELELVDVGVVESSS